MTNGIDKEIEALVQQLRDKELRIKELENELAQANSAKTELEQNTIPDVMLEHGLTSVGLSSGSRVEVKPFYYARVNKDTMPQFFMWLRKNGHGPIVKSHIEVWTSDTDVVRVAKEVFGILNVDYENTENIHWKTLESWFKEQTEKKEKLPTELFNNFIGRKAKVT